MPGGSWPEKSSTSAWVIQLVSCAGNRARLHWTRAAYAHVPWYCCHFNACPIRASSRDGGTVVTSLASAVSKAMASTLEHRWSKMKGRTAYMTRVGCAAAPWWHLRTPGPLATQNNPHHSTHSSCDAGQHSTTRTIGGGARHGHRNMSGLADPRYVGSAPSQTP